MSLEPGDRVGPYEILSVLGAGGMGVVYRARDSTLGREVAIKTLPEGVAADPDRLARFEREARVLASLNHANVATVFGFSSAAPARAEGGAAKAAGAAAAPATPTHFLTMELVEGETLEDRIARGPIPIAQALALFIQIAQGLEAAHAKGIVHRDLKPANVKVGPAGSSSQARPTGVKILDFGLAKALAPDDEARSASVSHSPTLTLAATMRGEILGTAAYMAPEQAMGEPADHRADIWAFGVCLLEALTGKRVFDGANHSFVLASVLKDEPSLDALPAGTPPQVRRLLRRCLEKDRERRFHDIADARLELEEALSAPGAEVDAAAAPGRKASRAWIAGAAAAGLAIGVAAALLAAGLLRPDAEPVPPSRFVLVAPPNPPAARSPGTGLAISPDGRTLIYAAGTYPATTLQVRRLDQLASAPLQGAQSGAISFPFFSPDGKWVGFFSEQGSNLLKVSVLGGPSVTLGKAPSFFGGASWGLDDTIVFGVENGGLHRVAGAGGEIAEVTQLAEGEVSHRFPEVLPDGRAVLFTVFSGDDPAGAVHAVALGTGERKLVAARGTQPRYLASGHVMYAVDSTLYAVPFDPGRLEATGDPVPVVEGVARTDFGAAKYALSGDGTLVYVSGSAETPETLLAWVDREGREEAIDAPPRFYVYPRLSPDGTRIALDVRAQEEDIWIWDLERSTLTRLTFSPRTDAGPVWSPDGRMVYFGSAQEEGGWDIFGRLADGTGSEVRLTQMPGLEAPASVTPDGTGLVAITGAGATGPFDIVLVDTAGGAEAQTLLEADFNLANAELSPDGRWLAYESNESGAAEIFVRPFPALDSGRWQVSTGGGTRPLWSRDGSEIFYLRSADEFLMAVPVEDRGEALAFGRPEVVVERSYLSPRTGRTYDVSPDGRRFLVIRAKEDEEDPSARQIVVVQSWMDEVRRLAPPG